MSKSGKRVIPLPVDAVARSTIAPPTEPQPDLPSPFKPLSVRVSKQDVRGASEFPAFDLLPRILIPVPGPYWKPPVMRYGWPAPRARLLAYARENGLVRMATRRNPKLTPDESDVESLNFESDSDTCKDDDSANKDESAQPGNTSDNSSSGHSSDGSRTVTSSRTTRATSARASSTGTSSVNAESTDRQSTRAKATKATRRSTRSAKVVPSIISREPFGGVDQYASMCAALVHIIEGLQSRGVPFAPRTIRFNSTLQRKLHSERQLVSIYTNYDLRSKDLPSVELIQEFGKAIGIETPPKWYIDDKDYEWRPYTKPYRR